MNVANKDLYTYVRRNKMLQSVMDFGFSFSLRSILSLLA